MLRQPDIEQTLKEFRDKLRYDPIFQLLSSKSSLHKIQLETVLLDAALHGNDLTLSVEKKARFRNVSKGAYNRSLAQAKKRIREAIFTVVLLGYLRLFGASSFSSLLDIGERLRSLSESYGDGTKVTNEDRRSIVEEIRRLSQSKTEDDISAKTSST